MSYTALYRKFRPQEFADVKGQDHIVTTLKNQIKADRIGHAYLFCGTRGTGKTTVAKIFAKAVNCEHPVDGSPCGECESCLAIAAGTSMNVVEIDAASNNGVDNIRQIREEVEYRPTEGRYRVYIIDEVHMLSIGAFNALLKTLEEPPSYVIFILATTEAHKIPITILSRCQRYDFRRISIDTITDRLAELMREENVAVEEKALRYVAKMGDGSMRDALSLLDQCIAFYLGQELTYDRVLETLGAADTEVFSRLLREILSNDVKGAIAVIDEMVTEGRELGQFVTDFTWHLRNLLLVQNSDDMEDVLDVSSENLSLLKEESRMADADALMRYIRIFSELGNDIKYASQKRILTEIAVIKLCRPEMEQDVGSLSSRIDAIEKKIESGLIAAGPGQAGGVANTGGAAYATGDGANGTAYMAGAGGVAGFSSATGVGGSSGVGGACQRPPLPTALPDDVKEICQSWNAILTDGNISGLTRGYFKKAIPSLDADGRLMLVFDEANAYGYVSENRAGCQDDLKAAIANRTGKEANLTFRLNDTGRPAANVFPDLREQICIDIVEEDF